MPPGLLDALPVGGVLQPGLPGEQSQLESQIDGLDTQLVSDHALEMSRVRRRRRDGVDACLLNQSQKLAGVSDARMGPPPPPVYSRLRWSVYPSIHRL